MDISTASETLFTGLDNALIGARSLKAQALTSDYARYCAVLVTEIEKVIAYAKTYVVYSEVKVTGGE
jgi:hypothetical protein